MNKFFVLSLLVLGCSAQTYKTYSSSAYGSKPYTLGHATGYSSGYGSKYGSGYGSGYGLGSSVYGAGYGSGQTLYTLGSGYGSSGLNYQSAAVPVSVVQALPVSTGVQYATVGLANTGYTSGAEGYKANFLTAHQGQARQEVVQAAVHQVGRTVEYKTVPNQEQPIEAQVVDVEPSDVPLHIHFKSRSSTVTASQSHVAGEPQEVQHSSSQDEPSRLVHEVQKPVVQEVREVITPYRQVTQEIQPVVESVHTVVTKGEGERQQYNGKVQYQSAAPVATVAAVAQPTFSYVQAAPAAQQSYSYVQAAPAAQQSYSYVQAAPVAQQSYSYVHAAPAAQSAQVLYVQPAAATTGYQANYGQTYEYKPVATTGYTQKSTSFVSKPTYSQTSYKVSQPAYTSATQGSYTYKAKSDKAY